MSNATDLGQQRSVPGFPNRKQFVRVVVYLWLVADSEINSDLPVPMWKTKQSGNRPKPT